jgi:hypothetical protein
MAVVTVDGTKGLYLPEAQVAEIGVPYSDGEVRQAIQNGMLGSYDLSTGRKLK